MTLTMPISVQNFPTTNLALSDEAQVIARHGRTFDDPDHSITIGERLRLAREAFQIAIIEAIDKGWDGYNAKSAHPEALLYAWDFIRFLPTSTPLPELAIDVDGDVAIEWDYARRRILSVRVGRDGLLNYAGMEGYATFYGTEVFQESIPSSILAAIERVVKANRT